MLVGGVRKIQDALGDGKIGLPTKEEVGLAHKLRTHILWNAIELEWATRVGKQ
jgi:hypothetical protein